MDNSQAWVPDSGDYSGRHSHSRSEALSAAVPTGHDERARTLSLIDFLADYDATRNPPVYDISKYRLFLLRDADLPIVPGVQLSPAAEAWLTVEFLDLPARPDVPVELVELLGESASISPLVRPEIIPAPDARESSEPGTNGITGDRQAGPDPALLAAADRWVATVWEPFAAKWAEATAAKELHRELFQQRELLATDRESVELVWGFGRLRWGHDGEVLDHPLVCIPVEVEEDRLTQRIRVCPAGAPEVEARCLAGLSLADRAGFMSIRQSVNDEGAELWDAGALHGLLRRLIRAIDHSGMLVEQTGMPRDDGSAIVDGSWVLYMRRRLPDYQGFLDRMRELYRDESVAVPLTLQAVVTDAPSMLTGDGAPEAGSRNDGDHEPLLLPLPTNEEQQRILFQAQHRTGVTVQGPPGTGKSHTIANIISHYVAYGRRVLVVAEKEQALRALTDKIPAGIKDLTVSVLGADSDSRRELEAAIGQIQTRVTAIDKRYADERIRQLTADLDEANRAIAVTTQALLAAREAEVERLPGHWTAGDAPTRAQAARWVAEHAQRLGYIADPITPATPPPVKDGDVAELIRLIREVGASRADACAWELPRLTDIPTASDVAARLGELADLQTSVRSLDGAVQDWGLVVGCGRDGLRALADRSRSEMEWATKMAGSWVSHVQAQAGDPLLARDWQSFAAQLAQDRHEALRLRGALTAHRITIPQVIEPSFLDGLRQARERLAQGGRLGMFAGPAKRAMQECQVDGRPASTAEDVDFCVQAVTLDDLRRRMLTSWQNQMARISGPDLDAAFPEDILGRSLEDLGRALSWPQTWAQLRTDLVSAGISAPIAPDASTLGQLAEVCARACDQILLQQLSRSVQGFLEWLRASAQPPSASALWGLLADALTQRDLEQWRRLREQLSDLHEIAPAARRLRDLRQRLSVSAPIWTARVISDPAASGDPADFSNAWQWRQLDSWVRAALTGPSPAQLQSRLEELSKERRRVVAELVAERAWRRLADNLGDRQRQALNSYVRAVTRFGKTGGKFAQRWLSEIRAALDESKDAVPVWIMPTARALTSFRPEASPPFDVLVVDEASQIGLEATPLLALARKTIVVGDDKQTSPEHVGLNRQQVFDLLDEHLSQVPKYRTLFDPDNSLYDIAFQKFPGVVMLTEHFRCLPPIIGFSNTHAYNRRIIPLRDQPPRPGWSALGAVKVVDGYRKNRDVNEPEADAVVQLVAEMCADPDYRGMDMGVISLLGSTQSRLIADKLYDRLGPAAISQRRLRSGEAANFQGDERDVIIISTVVAVDPNAPTSRIAAMTSNAGMRRINVAASRARQQMWVVHSVEPEQFPDGDLRGALIRHCRDAGETTQPPGNLLDACESQFERDVLQKIMARGYRKVSVQHNVGRYRIDIVVEGPHARLAVECDGDRWHGPDVWHKDRARQQVLERANWTFERIRGSAFYRDPEDALLPLWQRLDDLAIPTGEWWATEAIQPTIREVSGLSDSSSSAEIPHAPVTVATEKPDAQSPARPAEPSPWAGPIAEASRPGRLHNGLGSVAEQQSSTPRAVPDIALAPYQVWIPQALPHPESASVAEIAAGLVDIVSAEGPMHAHRAYRLYTQAAGGHRVGTEIRRAFHAATRQALRTGVLQRQDDDVLELDEKTLYLSGEPSVVVRELGPRQLSDIPRSEVAALIRQLELTGAPIDSIKRAVLDAYGLVRLTAKASQYLDECLDYLSST